MKSSELRGTGEVFRFTLIQTLKSKAFIISVVFMLVMALFSSPVIQLIYGGDSDKKIEHSKIKKAYICNELPFLQDGTEITKDIDDQAYADVEFVVSSEDVKILSDKLEEEGAQCESIIVHPYVSEVGGVTVELIRVSGGAVKADDCKELSAILCKNLDKYKEQISGLPAEQLELLHYEYTIEMNYITPDGTLTDDKDKGIGGGQFGVVYAILIIVSMLCIIASSQVATAVVTDKSSRVVELLLTSVRPMALLLGKIFAMLVATIGQIVLMLIAMVISNKITGRLFGVTKTAATTLIPKGVLSNLTVTNAVIAIVLIALGLLFYAIFAGVCGAMVSKMEELQEALKYFTFLSLIGMYGAIAAIISMQSSSQNIFVKVCEMFPLTSPMITPGARIIGVTPISYALIAIVILLILDFVMLTLAARVYEGLITNMGNPMKLKEVVAMLRNKRKGGAES
ncbi:MAG: ABC transporter permease [Lachnospiraceae bacterium]|nr:ABC transporter permease [Lachnospiraceae bacterium]